MIPKKIHYCWFGHNPLPESARKCIASWRKFFPDYEIIEWNEDNFDVNFITYTAEAYQAKKYAFVSDYARFKILYENGGLYFDTDVEVIRPMDDIIERGPFMGSESKTNVTVSSGLGLGAPAKLEFYKEVLDYYSGINFDLNGTGPNGTPVTVVTHVTDIFKRHGLKNVNEIRKCAGIFIYPHDYFNPLDDNTGKLTITDNTRSIHWFSKTWLDVSPWRIKLSRLSHRYLGYGISRKIRKIFRL